MEDKEFHNQVRGKSAIRKMIQAVHKLDSYGLHIDNVRHLLSEQQQHDWEMETSCSLLEDKEELIEGFVLKNGRLVKELRCMQMTCKYFRKCRPDFQYTPMQQVESAPEVAAAVEAPILPDKDRFEIDIPEQEMEELSHPENWDALDAKLKMDFHITDDDSAIVDDKQSIIIQAFPETKMLVKAGPGTGKTYSLIQKLKQMVLEYGVDPGEILVLCFTRAAVKEIRDRLYREVKEKNASGDLLFIDIKTFDSFATQLLLFDERDITGTSYDDRIELAVETLKTSDLQIPLRHLIVDEVQDLFGVRARFVKALLECFERWNDSFGFTLLGDPLQAIYDYQLKDQPDELTSDQLLQWVEDRFGDQLVLVTMDENRRQQGELAEYMNRSRKWLLDSNFVRFFDSLNEQPKVMQIRLIDKLKNIPADLQVGLLCRNNGQALKLSHELRITGVRHTLVYQRTNRFPYWLTDLIVAGKKSITQEKFVELMMQEFQYSSEEAARIYQALIHLEEKQTKDLKLENLWRKIASGVPLPDDLFIRNESIKISTIHQAKGREFDFVYLSKPDSIKPDQQYDEGKVYYVGITRAKKALSVMTSTPYFFKKSSGGRWYQVNQKKQVRYVEFGFDHDLDECSFINPLIVGNVEENQNYIRHQVKTGDPVQLIYDYDEKIYKLCHNGKIIGAVSRGFMYYFADLLHEAYKKTVTYRPETIEELYVTSLYSVCKKPETLDHHFNSPFAKRGVWYGVGVTGFGKLDHV
jgi:hypothetical protein